MRVSRADTVTVYCAVIRSMIEYASVVFANLPRALSNDLERVQKRALAMIYPSHSCAEEKPYPWRVFRLGSRRDAACKKFIAK